VLANFVVKRGRLRFINAELNHWNIGLWIDVAQNRPSTVVETPAVVATPRHRCEQFLDARSEVGITGRGILQRSKNSHVTGEMQCLPGAMSGASCIGRTVNAAPSRPPVASVPGTDFRRET
jgi:hypothetical protein